MHPRQDSVRALFFPLNFTVNNRKYNEVLKSIFTETLHSNLPITSWISFNSNSWPGINTQT